jgi:hypothetical protein
MKTAISEYFYLPRFFGRRKYALHHNIQHGYVLVVVRALESNHHIMFFMEIFEQIEREFVRRAGG